MNIKNRIIAVINVLKTSFIVVVPFYIVHSIVLLLVELSKNFGVNLFISYDNLFDLVTLLSSLFPIIINISISYNISSLYKTPINRLFLIILSLSIFLGVDVLKDDVHIISYTIPNSMLMAIVVPLVSSLLLSFLISKPMNKQGLGEKLSSNVFITMVYIFPFILTFFIMLTFFYIISVVFNFGANLTLFSEGYEATLLFIRTTVSNLFWLIGIHGLNFFDTLIDVKILDNYIKDAISYKDFFNYFILLGGSGAGLSLIFSIFIFSKDKHITFIGKSAFPFVLFNINEILIFGIPIFMNFTLIIPFIIVPIVNFLIAYPIIVYTDLIEFKNLNVPWTTPALVNSYIATNGNIFALLLQTVEIIIGVLIYAPFIRRYSSIQSSTLTFEKVADKFDISVDFDSKADIKFQEAQSSLIKSHFKINKVIELINQHNLVLYYQPKINPKNGTCASFEALLRKKDSKGNISMPDFILDVENSGLAPILDLWVCKEVKRDFDEWNKKGLYPEISINIFPHTLEDEKCIKEMISILYGYNIGFEILERRALVTEKIKANLNLLREKGFSIYLDDLGVGYTNFLVLHELPLDYVKIDREIIQLTNSEKGLILFNNICNTCHDLGYKIVLEGVETQEEFDKVFNKKVDLIQGWYYSKAISAKEVVPCIKNFKV